MLETTRTCRTGLSAPVETIFDQASRVFPGWTDPETGLRVLCIHARGTDEKAPVWSTLYHQCHCFLDGGRKVLLSGAHPEGRGQGVVDLTTGKVEAALPVKGWIWEVNDCTGMATILRMDGAYPRAAIWDLGKEREVVGLSADSDWKIGDSITLLSDGVRAIASLKRGRPYGEPVHTQHLLLSPGEPARLLLDAPGYHCSHPMSCPTDPEIYAYDRWPSPPYPIEQAIHIRSLDGRFEEPLKLLPGTLRPVGADHGARDHYLWTPDGRWIVSYLYPHPLPKQEKFNHLEFEWWLSATDWRTGEDRSAKYPAGRWGGHMGVSPDSQQILCAGGPGFDKLFLVSIEQLKDGWNERVLCNYPSTVSKGVNADPFAMPFALPDQSGVIFNAGWPGPEHGVYLVEWPGRSPRSDNDGEETRR
jgi:hypothetical protein